MLLRFALILLVACGGSGPSGPGPSAPRVATTLQPGDVAFTDVSVVPMSQGGVLAHQTVVVRGDRIVAVAPSASLAIPAGVTTIDGTNKWLMPGLADMHVHTWMESDLTLFIAAGVTTVRNMFGNDQHLAWRSEIARGERLGPTIVTAGPIIDGEPPVWPGSAVLAKPADADKIVAEQKAQGYDFLKVYSRLSREAYEALAAAGKRQGMPLAGHVPAAVGLTGVLAAKQRSVEHLDGWLLALVPDGVKLPEEGGMQAKLRVALPRLDEARLPGLIAQTIAAGTWNCPTLVVLDRVARLDDPAAVRRGVAWLDKVSPAMVAQWDPKQDFRFKAFTAEDFATMRAANAWRARILARLAAANAPILVGTDTGNPFLIPGEALHDELELMVAAGVPRARVLRAATAGAAEYLGTPRAFGVVEAGARADLVLVAVNPLEALLPLVPDGVMVRGTWLPRAELEAKLAEITKRNAAPPAQSRWDGVPPLPAEGKIVHQAHYDMTAAGKPIGEERLAVGVVGGKRVIVAQEVAEFAGRIVTSYKIGPDTTTLAMTSPFGSLQLAGQVTGGKLVATGTDRSGKPLSLSEPVPAGAFLSGAGIGSAIVLAEKLAGMKVGDKRQLASLELAYFPVASIAQVRYDVERKPDANGHRVFAIATTMGRNVASGELVVDDGGFVVSQTFGPPLNLTFTRRP
jgi:imidazolonepropionase-like amidohydrolase